MGLDEMFDELYEEGRRPDEPGLGAVLIPRAREKCNYIPRRAEGDFAQALLREYRKYVEQRLCGCKPQPGLWHLAGASLLTIRLAKQELERWTL